MLFELLGDAGLLSAMGCALPLRSSQPDRWATLSMRLLDEPGGDLGGEGMGEGLSEGMRE